MNDTPTANIMIDIETMGTKPGCAIVSIAAVHWDIDSGKTKSTFEIGIDLVSCQDSGLTIDAETLLWWFSQSPEVRSAWGKNSLPIDQALDHFIDWLVEERRATPLAMNVWAKSPQFDLAILKAAVDQTLAEVSPYWGFWEERDVRTLQSVAKDLGLKHNKPQLTTQHIALNDALHQASVVTYIYDQLRAFQYL